MMHQSRKSPWQGAQSIVGALSGKTITIPDANPAPMPSLAATGVIHDGRPAAEFGRIDGGRGYPDVRSFKRKFGLLIPATNTTMEHELWSLVCKNPALDGVGLHTANVVTPRPKFGTPEELLAYKRQFLDGLKAATEQVLLAQPQYLVMGMSLEHIIAGLEGIRAPIADLETLSGLSWATWHDAAQAALTKFGARRVGLLTPFEKTGNENASRMFEDLGFEVVSTVGFCCEHALHVAHVPDWAKEKAVLELLATADNRLDAVVQCGTNMSMVQVSERLEPFLGIPVIGINAALLWYALRENGFTDPVPGAGVLLREF